MSGGVSLQGILLGSVLTQWPIHIDPATAKLLEYQRRGSAGSGSAAAMGKGASFLPKKWWTRQSRFAAKCGKHMNLSPSSLKLIF